MLDPYFLIPIIISLSALALSLYRELRGPDISLVSKEPRFRLTDKTFQLREEYIPEFFALSEVPLIFANYGGRGGAILDIKISFSPARAVEEFIDDFSCIHSGDLPIAVKDGETCTIKLRPDIRTRSWKQHNVVKLLKEGYSLQESIDKAIVEGRDEFERFSSFLAGNREIGGVSCTVSLTVGRVWPKVEDTRVFQKIKVKNEYQKTINLLRKKLRNWDQLKPTRTELANSFRRGITDLISELRTNLNTLQTHVTEENLGQSRLRIQTWEDFNRERYRYEVKWYLIDRETVLKEDIERAYKQVLDYNARIEELLYLGDRRTEEHFEELFRERTVLKVQIEPVLKALRTLQRKVG